MAAATFTANEVKFLKGLVAFMNSGAAEEVVEEAEEAPAPKARATRASKTAAAPAKRTAAKVTRKKAEPEPEEEEEDDDDIAGLTDTAIKARLKKEFGYSVSDLKGFGHDELVETLQEELAASEDEDDEDVEDDEDDDEETEGGSYTREDLEKITSIRELRNIAKEEFGISPADYKGLDADATIDLMLGESDEDEDEDEEDVDDEDEADDDEDDEEEDYDPDAMSISELKALAKKNGVKGYAKMSKDDLIAELFDEE